ncbi:MAG: NAD(P)-dependent alcohol dehydrogenase [Jaaginema sp. PMC 1079.18]|nr:NAD(P)-dependent alcohol dehydrogenase [Jaaginema sp. PMC 1080.18]MEC4850166.1 NAD(P)-dependent alcohol dehydrogenase [Jaaginema sp. PMC 1079.18]MEC4865099.1 NAD(P)-dependent alcohol dehydrogenase [Jaaginema sp. PMC 1078.18]
MKAILIDRHGDAEVMQYRDTEKPSPTANEILVQIYASSVNPVDWKIRQGDLQVITGLSFPRGVGSDFAGIVAEVGAGVTRFRVGDAVYGAVNPLMGRTHAEYVAVAESQAALKPSNMSFSEAAAVPIAGVTALQSLRDLGKIQSGQKVLINGASGGVGTYAVQIAKAMDTEVTGVCSADNFELVESLGCDRVLDYNTTDFTQEGIKYDLIFDAVGKRTFWDCQEVLTPNGVYVSTLPSAEDLAAGAVTLVLPGKKAKLVLAQPNGQNLTELKTLIEVGKIRSIIDSNFPLAETIAAHRRSESHRAKGKVIITVLSEV